VLSGLSGAPVISVWGYNAATSTWSSYAPGAPSSLTAMADGNGYWIESPSSQTLTVTGVVGPTPPATPPTYSVVAGWNLVGFKSTDLTTSLSTYLAGTNPTTAYVFNSGTQSYNSVSVTSSTVYGVPGAGYWVAFPAAATIYPH
jgi:hypothetical protein